MSRHIINHNNILLTIIIFVARSYYINIKPVMGNDERTIKLLYKNEDRNITDCIDIINVTEIINVTNVIIERFINLYPVNEWIEYGFFDESYLNEINVHWLTFKPPNRKNHFILAGCYVLIMIVGLFGNLFVIILFIRRKNIRTPANILVMNLAVSDFLMMSKMPIFIYNSILRGPALGKYACRYFGFLGGLSGTVSICTLAAISLDRYYVIKYPLRGNMTNLRVKLCLVMVWVYGCTFSLIPLLNLGLGNYVPEGYLTSCSFDYLTNNFNVKMFIFVFFVAAWLIPFIIITFSYTNIIYIVIITRNVLKHKDDSSRHVPVEMKRQEVRLALIVLLIICLWFIAWTPYATIALLGITGKEKYITPLCSMIPALFCKSASCIDPFVYAFTHPRFKNELRRILFKEQFDRKFTGTNTRMSSYRSTRRSTGKQKESSSTTRTPTYKLEEVSLADFKNK